MADPFLDGEEPFDTPPRDLETIENESLQVAVDGFEGPLDLLLTLARTQKVDLAKISVLQLAEQYLEFVEQARKLRLELAADYLVMAAWLAYLKSRLLLPKPEGEDGMSGEDMAAHLAFQLERLEAMRTVAAKLMARDQLGRDFFKRGMIETVTVRRDTTWSASLSDLLKAYARIQTREDYAPLNFDPAEVLPVDRAMERLKRMLGKMPEWGTLVSYLPEGWALEPGKRRSAIASSFSAMLELAKRGDIEIKQEKTFSPIFVRDRFDGGAAA
ncbi:MAG: ScpA family protein [Pseudomonadota bacterium]